MKRIVLLFILILMAGFALFLLYPNSKTKFTLELSDGKGSFVYSCDDLSTEAQTLVQAELAHVYYQDQIIIMSKDHARIMVDAMSVANETGDLSDLEAANARINQQRRELVREVERMFDCRSVGDRSS